MPSYSTSSFDGGLGIVIPPKSKSSSSSFSILISLGVASVSTTPEGVILLVMNSGACSEGMEINSSSSYSASTVISCASRLITSSTSRINSSSSSSSMSEFNKPMRVSSSFAVILRLWCLGLTFNS